MGVDIADDDSSVVVDLTTDHVAIIRTAAAARGLSTADFLRLAALEKAQVPSFVYQPVQVPPINYQVYWTYPNKWYC